MIMTPHQVVAVAALGGLATAIGLIAFVAFALGIHAILSRLLDACDAYRTRRAYKRDQQQRSLGVFTDAQRAIDALPTTDHPHKR
ncbi:hypothetical protein ACPCK1_02770 [Streptomyces pseudogriseolus]|uniref:hypothetical protein n=1 Tax=Streptomyces pseudogriseolus TaxID=36817 RepID=UPI003FA2115D